MGNTSAGNYDTLGRRYYVGVAGRDDEQVGRELAHGGLLGTRLREHGSSRQRRNAQREAGRTS